MAIRLMGEEIHSIKYGSLRMFEFFLKRNLQLLLGGYPTFKIEVLYFRSVKIFVEERISKHETRRLPNGG